MTTSNQNTPAHDDQQPALCSVRKAGGMGSLLRSLAGTPAGWRPTRRGSFLVLVVGTLALLAVMAIIYSSIGNHDVRMKAAVAKHERLEDAPEQIKNYILSIIGDSVTATYYDSKDGMPLTGPVQLNRVTFDFPSTSYLASSTVLTANGATRPFSPTGSVSGFLGTPDFSQNRVNQMPNNWQPSTPWLADSEPTFLNWNGQVLPPEVRHLYRRDWGHISNIAPDGRFINLCNLRGNFEAESGFGTSPNSRPRMSNGVNQVFDANGSLVAQTDYGQTILPLNPLPAQLDSRQVWLFRPAKASGLNTPDSLSYEPYLFADADGDGMFDSRWQELFDARAGVLKNLLSVDPKFRYAVAVRITDLSGNINVNTATDSRTEASAGFQRGPRPIAPAGLSPADVDLQRLLSGQVPFEMAGLTAGVGLDGIAGSTQPPGTPTANPSDYGGMDQTVSYASGEYAYSALRLRLASGITPPADIAYAGPNFVTYFSGQFTVPVNEFDFSSEPEKRWEYYNQAGRSLQSAAFYTSTPNPSETRFQGDFGLDDLLELVTRRAVNDPNVTSSLELTLGGRLDPVGNVPDRHSPLRSNRGLDLELRRYPGAPTGPAFEQTMTFFNADVRQRLTTVSGTRQLRQAPSYDLGAGRTINPYALDTNELRIDPKLYLPIIRTVDQTIAVPGTTQATVTPAVAQQKLRHMATNKIFRGFVDALAPRLGVGDPWAENGGGGPRSTEFYGYRGPELAVRIAAHMTVNLIDAFDTRRVNGSPNQELADLPTVHTLLLDRDFASTINGYAVTTPEGRAFGPWKDMTPANATETRALQLPDGLLGSVAGGHDIKAPAINVFGVEPQPFITQVANFTVYADVHRSNDNETTSGPANIEATVAASNPDVMYRVIAFQLHNPFDTKIVLGGKVTEESPKYSIADTGFPRLDRAPTYYYLSFNGHTFQLGNLEQRVYTTPSQALQDHNNQIPALPHGDADLLLGSTPGLQDIKDLFIAPGNDTHNREPITLGEITINAGETVVVYALSDTPREIMERLKAIDSRAGMPGNFLETDVPNGSGHKYKEFRSIVLNAIEANLGKGATGVKTYWIPEIDTNGMPVIPHGEFYYPSSPGNAGESVQLWRALRSGPDSRTEALHGLPHDHWAIGTSPNPGGPATIAYVPNLPENDQLVDRFQIPHMDQFDTTLTGSGDIAGSTSTDDTKLFMLTKWAAFARKGNPGGRAPKGALPAFCIEPKYNIGSIAWNDLEADTYTSLNETDFEAAGSTSFEGAAETLEAWLINMARTGANTIPDNTIAKGPEALTTSFPPDNVAGNVGYETKYPEIVLPHNDLKVPIPNTTDERVLLRPADLLLPLGIGPEEMPVDNSGALITDMVQRWTTLGEAMALALGYQAVAPASDVMKLFEPAGPLMYWPLDRGNLRLDSFAPFLDVGGTVGSFDQGTDTRVGLQIPLALNILDTFTTNPVDMGAANWETLKRATPGTVNINTASLMTLEAGFPMLSPPPYNDPFGNAMWWWGDSGNRGPHDDRADLAASLVAYRNKLAVQPRPASEAALTAAGFDAISFNVNTNGGGGALERPDWTDGQLTGRYDSTGIAALHEYPGFRSIGELLSVRFQPPGVPPVPALPTSMDYLGSDANPPSPGWNAPAGYYPNPNGASGRIGVDSSGYTSPAGGPSFKVPSAIANSYKEQLEIINSVLPSVSTRSDYFCVWFLVHGYQKSDCEGLGATDPLVPSIARRFVMVVDRSKVTKKGELPEVLLFKEVPVDPMTRP